MAGHDVTAGYWCHMWYWPVEGTLTSSHKQPCDAERAGQYLIALVRQSGLNGHHEGQSPVSLHHALDAVPQPANTSDRSSIQLVLAHAAGRSLHKVYMQ